ncbi:MAG: helix-turn-helix domain-containing protein [Pseudonocardiales bacterium]
MLGRLGDALRDARVGAGLRQGEVAARAGVDQSMVSRYERGLREPSWPTFLRLLDAATAAAEVRVEALPGSSDDLTIAVLATLLGAIEDERRRRRLVLEFVSRYGVTDRGVRVGLLIRRPEPTGDARWDALLAGLAEHLAFHDAVDAPGWCVEEGRFLDTPWYWVDLPSVRRRALLGTPSALRRRNVWVDRVDLERV